MKKLDLDNFSDEKYDSCWFEIKTGSKKIVTRDHEEFIRKSEALSLLHEITLYRIEKTVSGLKRSRLHAI